MSDRKDSWQEREELVNEDLRYAIKIKKVALEREELRLMRERKPPEHNDDMRQHLEYTRKHLEFMQQDADRKEKVDAENRESCEDQRKQLARIADSLEKIIKKLRHQGIAP